MVTIIHGENVSQSRKKLIDLLNEAKKNSTEIVRLHAKKLTRGDLEEALGKTSLFAQDHLVMIEELHSLPRSKKKTELINLLTEDTSVDCILWEKRKLTKTMLKQFPSAKVLLFKATETLFSWLDSLQPQKNLKKQLELFQSALRNNDEYLCFIMLARQVRMMIIEKTGGRIAGPPFMRKKIQSQAQQFQLSQLLNLHARLYELDLKTKTSASSLTLGESLGIILLDI